MEKILNKILRRYNYAIVFFSFEVAFILYSKIFPFKLFILNCLYVLGIFLSLCWLIWTLFANKDDEEIDVNASKIKQREFRQILAFLLSLSFLIYWLTILMTNNCITCNEHKHKKAKSIDSCFESIRNDEASLITFFSQMPKGGDLHNHFSGAIYAESYLEDAIARKLWIDSVTLNIEPDKSKINGRYLRIDTLINKKNFESIKQGLFQNWSIKDYFEGMGPSDKHFFGTFDKFPKGGTWKETQKGLIELKERAKAENVQYLEIMMGGVSINKGKFKNYDNLLRAEMKVNHLESLNKLFQDLFDITQSAERDSAGVFLDSLKAIHVGIDDNSDFVMRYIVSVKRESQPSDVFQGLIGAFEAANKDSIVVGVNIVAPEDGEIAMSDYKLHMKMFEFLHNKYRNVKYSLHAGELTIGLVRPEDLTWHINEAVDAGASRIGHGVDMPFEKDNYDLLQKMRKKKIVIEINLVSNEFILKVKDDKHPIMLYKNHRVPIVISTDDAGILRTNLIQQFVLLAKRYKNISYADIKTFIKNSIEYSFIKEPELKSKILSNLENRISDFENKILSEIDN